MLSRSWIVMGVLALGSPAFAQSASAEAEVLFRQGRELLEAGKIAEACAAFESSQRASAATTTLFSIGVCREKNGDLATAWGAFVEVQRVARSSSDPSDQQLGSLAQANATRLEPRLSKLTLTVAHPIAGLEIRRGELVVGVGAWNRALPIDGGTYAIFARASGHAEWSTSVTVKAEGDTAQVEIPALAVQVEPPRRFETAAQPSRFWPALLGGSALVLGGAALGFELWAEDYNNQIGGSTSDARRLQLWHSANWRRYTAEGLGVVAIGAAGAAVYLFLRGDRESATQTGHATRLVPVASPAIAGLQLDGRW